jgi:hypothetical protein
MRYSHWCPRRTECTGKPRGAHPLGELVASDHLGELGDEAQARAEGNLALAGEIEQAPRRPLPE